MPSPQLSVRSAKARDIARRLAHAERRSIAQVVERALEAYEQSREPPPPRESAHDFWARLSRDFGVDIDLDAIIRADRIDHSGPDL